MGLILPQSFCESRSFVRPKADQIQAHWFSSQPPIPRLSIASRCPVGPPGASTRSPRARPSTEAWSCETVIQPNPRLLKIHIPPRAATTRRVATGIPVTQYVPSPSQNRTRRVTPSGSQFESSTMVWGRDCVARATRASNLSGLYQTAPT